MCFKKSHLLLSNKSDLIYIQHCFPTNTHYFQVPKEEFTKMNICWVIIRQAQHISKDWNKAVSLGISVDWQFMSPPNPPPRPKVTVWEGRNFGRWRVNRAPLPLALCEECDAGHLYTRKQALTDIESAGTVTLDFPASRPWEINSVVYKTASLWYCYSSLKRLRQVSSWN